jgi:hypothetical protein
MTITEQGPAYSLLDVKVLVVSGSTIVPVDLFYARQVTVDPQITTLTFEGDDTSQIIDDLTRIDAVVTCDKQDDNALQAIFGKTEVSVPASGETSGMWFGDNTEVAGISAGLQYDLAYKDESSTPHVSTTLRYRFPKGTVKVFRPQNAEYKSKHVMVLNFSFEKTSTDLAGSSLTGIPTGGAYFIRSRVS